MGIDPVIFQNVVDNVRAEILPRMPTLKLDPALIAKIAQKVPIFSGMNPAGLIATLAKADPMPLKAGETVFNEGDIGNSFYVLISGEVTVEKRRDGKVVSLAKLGAGECFGEMALVGNEVRSATVRALSDMVAMRFYRELIDADAQGAAIVYRNIARILAGRLGESSVMLADLVTQHKTRTT
jgi:CRP-like cAMP-binding protein